MQTDPVLDRWVSQARKGYLEMALLRRLKSGETYGYDLIHALKQSAGFEALAEGTVYPVLARMKKDALVTAEWRTEESGTPRKYYRITQRGLAALDQMQSIWIGMTEALDTL